MKKSPKIKYGIEITKPWSKEMYNHNNEVADEVRDEVWEKWAKAYKESEKACYHEDGLAECDREEYFKQETFHHWANATMKDIQESVLCYMVHGGTIEDIENDVINELEAVAFWRLKEIAEDLSIKLSKEFIGLK